MRRSCKFLRGQLEKSLSRQEQQLVCASCLASVPYDELVMFYGRFVCAGFLIRHLKDEIGQSWGGVSMHLPINAAISEEIYGGCYSGRQL